MSRRRIIATGLASLSLGAFVMLGGASVSTTGIVLQMGRVQVSSAERRPIPPWVGGVAAGIGLVVLLVGARQRP